MELWSGFSTITSLCKKYMYFGITQHIRLPWGVFALQVHPKTVSPMDMTLCYLCFLSPPSPREAVMLCLDKAAGSPWAQSIAQLGVTQRDTSWLCTLMLLCEGQMAPAMLFATQWHLNQCGEDQLDWGHPKVTLTLCDSRLGGTCWQRSGEIKVKMRLNWLLNTLWPSDHLGMPIYVPWRLCWNHIPPHAK